MDDVRRPKPKLRLYQSNPTSPKSFGSYASRSSRTPGTPGSSTRSPISPVSLDSPIRDAARPKSTLASLKARRSAVRKSLPATASSTGGSKGIVLLQSTSPESKAPPPVDDDDMEKLSITSGVASKDSLLDRLNRIEKNRSKRKSVEKHDLNEIKAFIEKQGASNGTNSAAAKLPTSLTMIGIRDPKSLLYHRQFRLNAGHDRANHTRSLTQNYSQQTLAPDMNGTASSVEIERKFKHLRSASSIVNKQALASPPHRAQNNAEYVKQVKNREPSVLFQGLADQTSLKKLVDDYHANPSV